MLQRVKKAIENNDDNTRIEPFEQVRAELSITGDGILLKGNQLVIPTSLRRQVVKLAHGGHMGIVKTKQLARQHVWYPGLDNDVEQAVKSCHMFQINSDTTKPLPTQMSPVPNEPWKFLSANFYGPLKDNSYLLVIIDDGSRFPVCRRVTSTAWNKVIPAFNSVLSKFGIPANLRIDNGPPFNSAKFKDFAQEQGFHHQKVTPRWAQANGHVERLMRNIGKVLRSAPADQASFESELNEFLRNYRATPHSSTRTAPSRLLFNGSA
jgi:hypothetical protein